MHLLFLKCRLLLFNSVVWIDILISNVFESYFGWDRRRFSISFFVMIFWGWEHLFICNFNVDRHLIILLVRSMYYGMRSLLLLVRRCHLLLEFAFAIMYLLEYALGIYFHIFVLELLNTFCFMLLIYLILFCFTRFR